MGTTLSMNGRAAPGRFVRAQEGKDNKALGLQEAQNQRRVLSKREVSRTMSGQTAPVIFLSHSGVDTEAARRLKRRLLKSRRARGRPCECGSTRMT